MTISYLILTAIQTILQEVSFSGIDPANIKVKELPKKGEKIDQCPSIFICPYGDDEEEAAGMEGEGGSICKYHVQVVILDFNEGDFQLEQEKNQLWKQQARNVIMKDGTGQFRNSLDTVPQVWSVMMGTQPTFDRSKLSEYYTYQVINVEVSTAE